MLQRASFQNGNLTRVKRKRGPDIWTFRWREVDAEGKVRQRRIQVGTVEQYRTEAHARKALASLGLEINSNQPDVIHPALMIVGDLVTHYQKHELGQDRLSKTQHTVDVYQEFLKYWILPRWKSMRPAQIKPVEVELWLRSLSLADGTRAKIRNIMSAVFQHGLRHQLLTMNPIRGLVRQSAKRRCEPDVLTIQEIRAILESLSLAHRVWVFLAASTGLRVSEVRGLQWQDVDFDAGVLHLRRGVVRNHITPLKSKASRKPVPLHPVLLSALNMLREQSGYRGLENWVFASEKSRGQVPVWGSGVMADHVLAAVKAAGIQKHVGWHTFRHSFATLLKGNGEDVKTAQELMRHATFQITMDIYTQAIPQALRDAHGKVVEALGPVLSAQQCLPAETHAPA